MVLRNIHKVGRLFIFPSHIKLQSIKTSASDPSGSSKTVGSTSERALNLFWPRPKRNMRPR